jgi:hypothetical protein
MQTSEGNYILLDDTAFLEAASIYNIEHMPAQIITRSQIKTIHASIYIEKFDIALVNEFLARFPRAATRCCGRNELKHYKDCRRMVLSCKGARDISICFKKSNGGFLPSAMFDFIEFISSRCRFVSRIFPGRIRTANLKLRNEYNLLKIPGLTVDDLLAVAESDYRFPHGFLRFDFANRIIGIEYPIRILNEKVSLREKERFLRDLVNYRFNHQHPEYFESGVYLLNYLAKK